MQASGDWPFTLRGALLLFFFALLVSLLTSLVATSRSEDWLNVLALHALFCLWIASALIFFWWLVSRIKPADWALDLRVWLIVLLPVLVLVLSVLLMRSEFSPTGAFQGWWLFRNGLAGLVVASLLVFYMTAQQQWRDRQAAESERRLDALQARIAPHFLFNTLNTLTELVHERPAEAEQAMLDMSDLLRTALRGASSHTLEDELELVRGYLRIEALRLGDRLQVDWSLPDDLPGNIALPALVIQPLVENAIVHGIARCSKPGILKIRAERRRFGRWRFVVENPLPDARASSAEGSLALDNIRQRLALAYDDDAYLKLSADKQWFRAELTLPERRSD